MVMDTDSDTGRDGDDDTGDGPSVVGDLRRCILFLTRLPLPGQRAVEPAPLAKCAWAFPVAGLVAAVPAAAVYGLAATAGLPPLPAAILCVACMVALTGALHEDGLADVADGFGGGGNKAEKLEIMRDSRIGGFGVIALTLCLAARITAIAAIAGPAAVTGAVIAAAVTSRAAMAGVLYALPPARTGGPGAAAGKPTARCVAMAVVLAFAISLAALDWIGADLAIVAALLVGGAVALLARRQVGGHTGDVLGAVQQAAEVAILLTLAAVMAPGSPAG